ncbi:MAG: holo-ACP synthase, partial [Planctomycetota bacterium]
AMVPRERFLDRTFTASERAYCLARVHPEQSFAARFCAKEAAMKCLGTGWTAGVRFVDVEVVRGERGEVSMQLHGEAARIAGDLGIRRWHVSLTHTDTTATAFVVAEA